MPEKLLKYTQQGNRLSQSDIKQLLSLTAQADLVKLFGAARAARKEYFGKSVFLYGFLYFSTHCRNNCSFCQYRRANISLERYRKSLSEIIEAAREMARTGVHLIDLTMGEDPELYRSGFGHLTSLVQAIKQDTGLPVMVSPGVLPDWVIRELAEADAEWLACYQETHNRELYDRLRPGQDYDKREASKTRAAHEGMLVEEGLLVGVGETLDDLADSIIQMRDQGYDQVRAMTFVPQIGTPMVGHSSIHRMLEKKVIAVMRLAMPDRLIPASLDVDGLAGLQDRLDGGANVVTSIVPPASGLAGVANTSLDIEDSRRSVAHVSEILAICDLSIASQAQYENWINYRRQKKANTVCLVHHADREKIHQNTLTPVQPLESYTHAIH